MYTECHSADKRRQPGPIPSHPGRTGTRGSGPGRAAGAWHFVYVLYTFVYFLMLSIIATAANFHTKSRTLKLVLRMTNQLCKIPQPCSVQWAKDSVHTAM